MNEWRVYKDGEYMDTVFCQEACDRDDVIKEAEGEHGYGTRAFLFRSVFDVKEKFRDQPWAKRHQATVICPTNHHTEALRDMLRGWENYRRAHVDAYGGPIGDCYVLGPAWAEVGLAIKQLLDGETGGFDCGTLDENILDLIDSEGIDNDGYEVE